MINEILSEPMAGQPTPEVGMGATLLLLSDRYPVTIVEVSKNGKQIVTQDDFYNRTDNNGISENQTYECAPNPDGPRRTFTLRKSGQWVRKGDSMKFGMKLMIGIRQAYYDFSF